MLVENLIGEICDGGCGVERILEILVIKSGSLDAKVDAKRLALEEGVHEDETELCLRGEKEEWQKFCETTFAKDQKE